MSVKIVVVFLCAAIGTATGYAIMRTYKLKHEYLSELCSVIAELKHDVSYRCDGVVSVMRKSNIKNKLLCKNIGEYISFAEGKADGPHVSKGYLNDDAYKLSGDFFSSVGRSDGKSQMEELKMFGEKCTALCAVAEEKSKKIGVASVKLGFLIGLGIGILVL